MIIKFRSYTMVPLIQSQKGLWINQTSATPLPFIYIDYYYVSVNYISSSLHAESIYLHLYRAFVLLLLRSNWTKAGKRQSTVQQSAEQHDAARVQRPLSRALKRFGKSYIATVLFVYIIFFLEIVSQALLYISCVYTSKKNLSRWFPRSWMPVRAGYNAALVQQYQSRSQCLIQVQSRKV